MTKKSNITEEDFRPIEWVEVPYYSSGVRAGLPEIPGDEAYETISIPKEFAATINFVIPVKGESMRDFGLQEGDNLCVHSQPTADNGDIVVASIDGECTVKTYCEDVDGSKWLVPGNPDFKPIYLDPDSDVRIFGVVKQVMQINPHVSVRDCIKTIQTFRKTTAGDVSKNANLSKLFRTDKTPGDICIRQFDEIITTSSTKQKTLTDIFSVAYSLYFNPNAFTHQELADELNRLQKKYNFTRSDIDSAKRRK